jgi:hypothetical protein
MMRWRCKLQENQLSAISYQLSAKTRAPEKEVWLIF